MERRRGVSRDAIGQQSDVMGVAVSVQLGERREAIDERGGYTVLK
jgi:hypothetical protein